MFTVIYFTLFLSAYCIISMRTRKIRYKLGSCWRIVTVVDDSKTLPFSEWWTTSQWVFRESCFPSDLVIWITEFDSIWVSQIRLSIDSPSVFLLIVFFQKVWWGMIKVIPFPWVRVHPGSVGSLWRGVRREECTAYFLTQRLGIFLRPVPSYMHRSLSAPFTVVCFAHQMSSLKPSCWIEIIFLGKPSYSILNVVTENKNMTHYRVQVIWWRKWDNILIVEGSPYPFAFCCRKKEEQPRILWVSSMPMGDVYRSLSVFLCLSSADSLIFFFTLRSLQRVYQN